MKILGCITELHLGGAENALSRIFQNLATHHNVEVIYLYGNNAYQDMFDHLQIKCHNLSIKGLKDIIGAKRKYRKIIEQYSPDLIHSWLFHANFLSRFACPKGTKLINSYRVNEPRRSHIILDKISKHRANYACCVSDNVKEFAENTVGWKTDQCGVIENGIDTEKFPLKATAESSPIKNGLTVGRIDKQKGLDILIEALGMISEIPWTWSFVGRIDDKAYHSKLTRMAEQACVSDRITWHPPQYDENLVELYHNADVFGLPSRWEGQANVILEALSCGLPVVASEHVGFNSGTPITTVAPNTPAAWASQLKAIFSGNHKFDSAEKRLGYVQTRSWESLAKQYEALYESLV